MTATEFLHKYNRLAMQYACRHTVRYPRTDIDGNKQAARIGVFLAYKTIKETEGAWVYTYVAKCIRSSLFDVIRELSYFDSRTEKAHGVRFERMDEDSDALLTTKLDEDYEDYEFTDFICKVARALSTAHESLFEDYYRNGYSDLELAAKYGISNTACRMRRTKLIRLIRGLVHDTHNFH